MFYWRALFLMLACFSVHATAGALAKVTAVGTYGEGSIFVFFDTVISSCGASQRIDLAASNPAIKNVLSVAETAFSTGSSVIINTSTCSGSTPVFTADNQSYIYLAK